jgi:hypothetical protein
MVGGTLTSSTAITTAVVAIATAIAGVAVAAGLPLSKDLQDHIITLITVLTPVVVAGIAWLHHSHAKIVAAERANNTSSAARVNV